MPGGLCRPPPNTERMPDLPVCNGQIAQFGSRPRGMAVFSFLPLRKEFRLLLPGLSVRNCRDRIKPAACADHGENLEFSTICVSFQVAFRPLLPSSPRSAQRNDRLPKFLRQHPGQNPCGKGSRIFLRTGSSFRFATPRGNSGSHPGTGRSADGVSHSTQKSCRHHGSHPRQQSRWCLTSGIGPRSRGNSRSRKAGRSCRLNCWKGSRGYHGRHSLKQGRWCGCTRRPGCGCGCCP